MAAARTLLHLGVKNYDLHLHLFDTFQGMSAPTPMDVNFRGTSASDLLAAAKPTDWVVAYSPLDEVKRNVLSAGYDADKIHFVPGPVETTLPALAPEAISLLRLDTDWYESTRHELVHLFPRLSRGGVLIVDDYGHWEGARRAVDEFMAEADHPLLLHRLDYTWRIAVKL